jgi:hypothetical protein
MAITAALFLAGALTSAVGIRNPPPAETAPDSQAPPPVDG